MIYIFPTLGLIVLTIAGVIGIIQKTKFWSSGNFRNKIQPTWISIILNGFMAPFISLLIFLSYSRMNPIQFEVMTFFIAISSISLMVSYFAETYLDKIRMTANLSKLRMASLIVRIPDFFLLPAIYVIAVLLLFPPSP